MSRDKVGWFLLVVAVLTVLLALLTMSQHSVVLAQQSNDDNNFFLFEYGSSKCPHCVPLHEFLIQNYDGHHYFCDISVNRTCLVYFNEFLNATGLPGYIPQTIVIKGEHVVALVIGEVRDKVFWDGLIKGSASNNVPVYLGAEEKGYMVIPLSSQPLFIKEYIPLPYDVVTHGGFVTHTSTSITGTTTTSTAPEASSSTTTPTTTTSGSNGSSSGGKGLIEMLGFLVPLALTDSVNPCTFVLYAVMLVSVSVSGSRGKVAAVGATFVIAVMSGYLMLGLGLSEVASFLPRQLVLVIAFAYAAFIIGRAVRDLTRSSGSGGAEVCREDDPECKAGRLARMFSKRVGILAAFALGLLASFTLLPCSAGPYIAFAMIISTQSLIERLTLLLAYNIVFVTPLILILVAMLGITKLSGVRDKLIKYSPHISLAGGVLLMIVAALMVLQA